MQNQTVVNSLFRSAKNHTGRIVILLCAGLLYPPGAQAGDTQPTPKEASGPAQPAPAGASKPSAKNPPFPRKGTDFETYQRENHEYMQWWHEYNENVNSILVQLRPEVEGSPRKLISRAKAHEIGKFAGLRLEPGVLAGSEGWQKLMLPKKMTEKATEAVCEKVKQHPDVIACDVNGAVFPMAVPIINDPLYPRQWSFGAGFGPANIEKAWDITTGSATTVVAVLDSGITAHEDLSPSRILPGYDFVSDPVVANDGGGRDADPSDPGNWVASGENTTGALSGCKIEDSSWHGTYVTGIVAATPNDKGVVGIDWAARILPVRVTGKCGNPADAPLDVSDAIKWAAGISMPGVPDNPNPAKVINMSISGSGACPTSVQNAINQATTKGAVVVAAAGNENRTANYWPAGCANVITVVATDEVGNRWKDPSGVGSNWGSGTGVSAPGTHIASTINPGTTTPTSGSGYASGTGTSSAAPHVSGIASLMLAVNPKLTPFEIRMIIQGTAKKFPKSTQIGSCGLGECGTGIVNAAEAVRQAMAKTPAISYMPSGPWRPSPPHAGPFLVGVSPDQKLVTWGNNGFGPLGGASASLVATPTVNSTFSNVDRVFAGDQTTYFILTTGEAYAMGESQYCGLFWNVLSYDSDGTYNGFCENPQYQFSFFGGDPLAPDSPVPVRVPALDNAKQIEVSVDGLMGGVTSLSAAGQVYVWGQFADATFYVVPRPTLMGGLPPIRRIAVSDTPIGEGNNYTLALDQSGNVWAWGYTDAKNQSGRACNVLGGGAPVSSSTPMMVPFLSGITDIKRNRNVNFNFINLALKSDGTVWQWGCGTSPTHPDFQPAIQIPVSNVVAINSFDTIVLPVSGIGAAIDNSGAVWVWSSDTYIPAPRKVLQGGALAFVDKTPVVRMADGSLFNLLDRDSSVTLSDGFAHDLFQYGSGSSSFSGRLNVANTTFDDDSDLQVAFSTDAASITVGQTFNFLASVTNLGTGAANNSSVAIALPTTVKPVSVPPGCTLLDQIVTCSLGTLAANQTTSIAIDVQALSADNAPASAYASSDSYDFGPVNNIAALDVLVQPSTVTSASSDADAPTVPEWGALLMGGVLLGNLAWARRQGSVG